MAPTRELVQQIAIEAKKVASVVGARVLGIYGGVGKGATVRAHRNADVFFWWFDGLLKTSLPAFCGNWNLVHTKKEWVNEMPTNERQYYSNHKTSVFEGVFSFGWLFFTSEWLWTGPQVSALKAGVDLLCATPGRLRDFMTGDKTKDGMDGGWWTTDKAQSWWLGWRGEVLLLLLLLLLVLVLLLLWWRWRWRWRWWWWWWWCGDGMNDERQWHFHFHDFSQLLAIIFNSQWVQKWCIYKINRILNFVFTVYMYII